MKEFKETLKQSIMNSNPLPKISPNLNSKFERFIKTIKMECLAKLIIFGKQHLDYVISELTMYYNTHRSQTARDYLPIIRKFLNEVEKMLPDEI